MTKIIIKYRILIIIFSILLAVAGILQLPRMQTDPDVKNYIPDHLVSRINTDIIEEEFGNQEMLVILFSDSIILSESNLRRIRNIDRSVSRLGGVDKTISLFNTKRIYGESGFMYVEPAIERIPRTTADIEELKQELRTNDLAMGVVVSDDFSMSLIAVSPVSGTGEKELIARIDSVIAENPGTAAVHCGGLPYIRKAVIDDVRKDGIFLIPLALVIMLAFLWLSFRDIKGLVLPFTVVILSIAIAMGLAPLLGWKLSILSLLVPVMLIAVANDYGIHLIARYQEVEAQAGNKSMSSISRIIVRDLRRPILFTGLTTIAGIMGLLTHSVIPAKHVGVLAGTGIAFAIIFSLFFLPACLSMLRKGKRKNIARQVKNGIIGRLLSAAAKLVRRRSKLILAGTAFLILVCAGGIFLLKVDANQENFFPAKHPVKTASKLINANFGGSQTISLKISGDIKDPGLLNSMERWSKQLEKFEGVDRVYSITRVLKQISKSLYEPGEEAYNRIPDSREGVAQMIELYNMSGDPDDFEQFADPDYSSAHMMIMFSDPGTNNIKAVLEMIDIMSARDGIDVIKGGYAYVMSEFTDEIVKGQLSSLIFAILVVFILLSIIFKSLQGGVLSSLPIIASVIFLLGFMGYTGITLNPATALLSSIMIGVGVDYTIHFLWRLREELRGADMDVAIEKSLTTTGRGIIINALSVIAGFSVLLLSGFTSIRHFGLIILISIGVCLVASLLVIPSMLLHFRPMFIFKKERISIIKSKKTGKIMRRAAITIFIILIGLPLFSQEAGAREIMKKSNEAMKVESFESRSILKIVDSRGRERTRENITVSKKYSDGTIKRLLKFTGPADIMGTSMLIYDYEEGNDDMWIYLPALKKTRRMVSSEKNRSFMGSDFSNADMSSPPLDDFRYSFSGTNTGSAYIIAAAPVNEEKEDEYAYSKRITYINPENYTVSRIEFYNFDNVLFKTIDIKQLYSAGSGHYIVNEMKATDHIKERYSELKLFDISTGIEARDDLFNAASLGR
ncbi:MAG: MMPL family transporter [Marinilabiliaceae bacterium]|jgi:hydrophobe/amphiphile efflux-3 (HAE3) family protein|nr:MMPL family transporter [Marinilabiliaceae bacterium]